MCNHGIDRIGYARVLIQVDARKGIHDTIDIVYCDKENKKFAANTIKVEHDWKPPVCDKCKVFRHTTEKCGQNITKEDTKATSGGEDGFQNVKKARSNAAEPGGRNNKSRQMYREMLVIWKHEGEQKSSMCINLKRVTRVI